LDGIRPWANADHTDGALGTPGSIEIHFRPFTYLIEKLLPSGGKNAHQVIFLTTDSLPLAKLFSCFPDWPSFPLCKK
jgi:hypothetical protein